VLEVASVLGKVRDGMALKKAGNTKEWEIWFWDG
jgi:hypothetical protein